MSLVGLHPLLWLSLQLAVPYQLLLLQPLEQFEQQAHLWLVGLFAHLQRLQNLLPVALPGPLSLALLEQRL